MSEVIISVAEVPPATVWALRFVGTCGTTTVTVPPGMAVRARGDVLVCEDFPGDAPHDPRTALEPARRASRTSRIGDERARRPPVTSTGA
jgi:hypothetical protein